MAYQGHHWGSQYDYSRPPPPPPLPQQAPRWQTYAQQQQALEERRPSTLPHLPPARRYVEIYSPQNDPYRPMQQVQNTLPTPPQETPTTTSTELSRNATDSAPLPVSRTWKGYAYALRVGQQPDRARMCGFGDKDRRPISPPPCVQLIIVDEKTGEEVDYNQVEDLSRFILIVDLADVETLQESNLVHHLSTSNPAIGSTIPGTYPPTQVVTPNMPQPHDYDITRIRGYNTTQYHGGQPNGNGYHTNGSGYGGYVASHTQQPTYGGVGPSGNAQTGTCSRNLIGSLSATSFKLTDTNGKTGLWFIFQDLSIRTEGIFRLKFTYFDLMCQRSPLAPATGEPLVEYSPLLASVYSQPFQVWSAKKFPGVRATTDLSQTFADQGIKIPVRKNEGKGDGDKKRKRGNKGGDDSGEDFDDDD